MSEQKRAYKLADKLLDEPYCDPDDDLRVLSRQLLRHREAINLLKQELVEPYDSTKDLINANRDIILKKYEEAIQLIRPLLDSDDSGARRLVIRVIDALNQFHPMHAESWCGWPK